MSDRVNVLVIGKGGREHALVWKLAQSRRAGKVFCAPGNAGTGRDGINVNIDPSETDKIIRFAIKENIGLVAVGPEDPLSAGIVDALSHAGLKVFGPKRDAARLETSKVFAKQIMRHADVPTAEFRVFDHPEPARQYIQSREYVTYSNGRTVSGPFPADQVVEEKGVKYYVTNVGSRMQIARGEPLVVKADGLAAGKGVFVCRSTEEALAAVERIMVREEFGRAAGRQVVIEKRLAGEELSIMALISGRSVATLHGAQDHKRLGDGDTGPNTGGMGAYCPAQVGGVGLIQQVEEDVFVPTVHAMKRARCPFRGLLYAGIMVTPQGPRVLEFNARFGDPETQVILMRLRTDLLDLLESVVDDRLVEIVGEGLEWDPRPAVTVVLASDGYPGSYAKGKYIYGIDEADKLPGVKVFHAGTKAESERVLTDGGRVLAVTALGDDLNAARANAYAAVEKIKFAGMIYRKDIGAKATG